MRERKEGKRMRKWLTMLLAAGLLLCAGTGAALEYTLEDECTEVRVIQEALLKLDFYYGDITGHYGERTARGIRLFQKKYGLDETGIADEATRERLYQVTGMTAPALSDMLIEMNVTLRQGDSGSEVRWLQESLTTLGHYQGEITGTYGGLTHDAVRSFQRASGLSGDGVAGRNTITMLAKALEDRERAQQEAILWEEEAQSEDQESITTLKMNVENSAVRKLQEDLEELGFYTGTVTGSFGRLTKEAVRLFQRAHDIPSDGVAGPVTLAAIEVEIQKKQAPTPTPALYEGPLTVVTPESAQESNLGNGAAAIVTPVPTQAPATEPIIGIHSSVGFLSIEREMKLYDQSEDVRQMQIALNALGYYSGAISGHFDLPTQAAVMGYQAAKELPVTGVVNQITLITINDDIFRRIVNAVD